MQIKSGSVSVRLLVSAIALAGVTSALAVGCGGGSSPGGPSPSGGSGGDSGDTATGGDGEGGSSAGKGGKGGKGGGGPVEEAGAGGEAGAIVETPAQNNSAVAFLSAGAISKSKNFVLVSGLGESLGGTVGSKRSKSLKYTYIPGVIAGSSPSK